MTTQTDIASSSSSSPPPPIPRWIYDVFLSFRGTDTRNGFTDFLYNTLKQKGINTFRDNEELERGKEIAPELLKAIEESRYTIVVLSENYADSSWCLDEVAKVVECMKLMGQTVVPVFYHVDPFEVRRQKGSFEKAFAKHEIRFKDNPEKVKRWRSALTDVANLSGWHLKDRAESEVVQEIVGYIFNKLTYQTISSRPCTELVGIDSRVNKLLDYLDMHNMNGVCTVGVLGMGGIGKTTIAQEVCDRIYGQFEAYSFVPKVREVSGKEGLVHLQKQLISDILMESNVNIQSIKRGIDIMSQRFCTKRVLIILDDVDDLEQLKALCGHGWFGSGSKVIITSRDRQLLLTYGIREDRIYSVRLLSDVEALQLFSWKSFKKYKVQEDFLQLSKKVVEYAHGLPLAIELLGSLLFGKDIKVWTSALDRLKAGNHTQKIVNVYKISFDALEDTEKEVFLDIACFFKGEDKDRVIRILESKSGYSPDIDIEVLMDKSIVNLLGRKVELHDRIQELGWDIVHRQKPYKDFQSDKLVELRLQSSSIRVLWKGNKQWRMLKFIDMSYSQYLMKTPDFSEVQNLETLILEGCIRLVEVHTSVGVLEKLSLWNMGDCKSVKSLPPFLRLESLATLKLSACSKLKKFPKIEGCMQRLSELHLDGTAIEELPQSIDRLTGLTLLNLEDCKNLFCIPSTIRSLKSLKCLILTGCSELSDISDDLSCIECLEELDISGTAIRDFTGIKGMKNLKSLSLRGSRNSTPKSWHSAVLGCLGMVKSSDAPLRLSLPTSFSGLYNHQQRKLVEDLSLPTQVLQKQLELLDYKSSPISSGCHGDEIPEWFSNVDSNSYIGQRMPPGLEDEEQWMGVSVVILVKGHPPVSEIEPETSNYFYKCIVGTEDFQLSPILLDWDKYLGSLPFSSHFLFFFYVPRLYFSSKNLNQSRLMCAFFWTNNPRMEVQKCGIRLLFKQGIPEFIQTYIPPAFGQDRKHKVICEFPVSSESENVDETSIDSGWLTLQIGGNLRWEKLIPTCTEEIQLRRNIESVLLRYLQELKQSAQNYDFHTRGCPAWFNPEAGEQVLIQLLPNQNLHKNKKWMGLALCASFVVDKHTVQNDYQVFCRLQRARSHSVGFNMSLDCKTVMMPGTHQLLVLYIPRAVIPQLFIQTPSEEICTVYTTHSPGVRVELYGLRVLYPQDVPEFVQTIMHCIFRSSGAPPEDWSTSHLACTFPGIGIPEWFMTVGKSDTAQIQLSPSLFYEGSWMGVAVCASLSIHEHPNAVFSIHDIFCFLESNITNSGVVRFMFPTDNEMWSHACDFVCFVYLPCVLFPESWNQSDNLNATVGSSSTGLGVQNCAIRLIFKEDLTDVAEMLSLCNLHAHWPHCEEASKRT
ncbi:hypothetical protein ACLB2K_021005 [Fragaria x ananassa]